MTKLMFIIPAFLVIAALLIYPIFSSLFYSITSKHLIRPSYDIVWLENFINVLTNPEFYKAFWVSLKWTLFSISGQFILGFIAALSLEKIKRFEGVYKTLLIIPWAFPAI